MAAKAVVASADTATMSEVVTGAVFIRVGVPALKTQKCLQFQLDEPVRQARQRVLAAFAKDLGEAPNHGLYMPPRNGRAGKFLDEERQLKEYPLQGPIGFLEFKFKSRVYREMTLNMQKIKQLHSKSTLRQFMEYVRTGQVDKTNKLTGKGLDPNFQDWETGDTPLTAAVIQGQSTTREVLLSLVSGGAHMDFRDRTGLTALHQAAISGNVIAVQTLLDLGVSPNLKDSRGLTALYHSVTHHTDPTCALMLLQERAFVGTPDHRGWYEIHQACRYGRIQHLEHLLFYGAELDVQNDSGNTALHVCAEYNQEECGRVLLFRGGDRHIVNCNNQTAFQLAIVSNALDLAHLIYHHTQEAVVPFRELPRYSTRRKRSPLTASMRRLLRCRSEPRLHTSVPGEQTQSTSVEEHYGMDPADSPLSLTSLNEFYEMASCVPSTASSQDAYRSWFRGRHCASPHSLGTSSASSERARSLGDIMEVDILTTSMPSLPTYSSMDYRGFGGLTARSAGTKSK